VSRQLVVHSTPPPNVGWNKYLREICHPLCEGSGLKENHYKRRGIPMNRDQNLEIRERKHSKLVTTKV